MMCALIISEFVLLRAAAVLLSVALLILELLHRRSITMAR